MCGLHAVNNILRALKVTEVTTAEIHTLARDMAQRECSLIYAQDAITVMDLEVDPRGNYAVDVLLYLLESRTGFKSTRWSPGNPVLSSVLLIGSGVHWQAILRQKDGLWFLCEQSHKNAIPDIVLLLEGKVKNGAVYQVGEISELMDASLGQGLTDRVRVMEKTDLSTPPPPGKRPRPLLQAVTWAAGAASQKNKSKPGVKRCILPQESTEHTGLQLPEEFIANPQFAFEGPKSVECFPRPESREALDMLLEAMSDDECGDSQTVARSQRCRTQTRLYQAEEEEKKEKEQKEKGKRAVRSTEEKPEE